MNSPVDWKLAYESEIQHAIAARQNGNEGRARVCARRAAGIVIGEYLHRHGHTSPMHSAYERLALFTSLPEVDERSKEVCRHFLVQVNRNHQLPINADLILEAQILAKILLLQATN